MTDHTAHIEECEREREAAWDAYLDSISQAEPPAYTRYARAVKAHKRALLDAYGVPCPVEACEGGHIVTDEIPETRTSPAELVTEHCRFCEGRGSVLPARASAYEGD